MGALSWLSMTGLLGVLPLQESDDGAQHFSTTTMAQVIGALSKPYLLQPAPKPDPDGFLCRVNQHVPGIPNQLLAC